MAVITQRTNLAPGLGTAFGEGLTQGYEEEVDRRALQNAIGRLPPNASPQEILKTLVGTKASPAAKQEVFKNLMGAAEFEQRQKQLTEDVRLREKALEISESKVKKDVAKGNTIANYKAGLQTVKEMKDLRAKGNLGRGSGFTKHFGTETQKDFGQYEQLGKSLISLGSNIPIRNRQEFEALAHNLYDPTIPDAQALGILQAMENIITRNLNEFETTEGREAKVRVKNKSTGATGWVTPFEGMESKYEKL